MTDQVTVDREMLEQYYKQTSNFLQSFNSFQSGVHEMAKEKGWWDGPRNEGEIIALCHSELSEALEYLRAGNPNDDKVTDMPGALVELADVVIRIMDYCGYKDWDLAAAMLAKVRYNASRPHKHGGKKF